MMANQITGAARQTAGQLDSLSAVASDRALPAAAGGLFLGGIARIAISKL